MSGNNEEIDNYAAQDLEIMNTKEATAYFCLDAKNQPQNKENYHKYK